MEHLVKSHMGGYYISNEDPKIIQAYCDVCNSHDEILVSWNEGKKLETLLTFFSKYKESKEQIEFDYDNGITKEELMEHLAYKYNCDIEMINALTKDEELTIKEQIKLLKQIKLSQKEQFKLAKKCGKTYKKQLKRNS